MNDDDMLNFEKLKLVTKNSKLFMPIRKGNFNEYLCKLKIYLSTTMALFNTKISK